MQSLPDSFQRLESCIERLEGRINRGVGDFSLGKHLGRSVQFKHVLNTLCDMILKLGVFVARDKPKISFEVSLIQRAVENVSHSVSGLDERNDNNWRQIVSAIVALYDTMHFYSFASSFINKGLSGICTCMMQSIDIRNISALKRMPVSGRNQAILDIFTNIGHNLQTHSAGDGYSDLFGHRGGAKMEEIITHLIGPN
jgi:hypothetical protein